MEGLAKGGEDDEDDDIEDDIQMAQSFTANTRDGLLWLGMGMVIITMGVLIMIFTGNNNIKKQTSVNFSPPKVKSVRSQRKRRRSLRGQMGPSTATNHRTIPIYN